MQFTVFRVGKNLFGIDVLHIQEINRTSDVTVIDRVDPMVAGVLNLRGQIVTILDPAVKMGIIEHDRSNYSRIIILKMAAINRSHPDTTVDQNADNADEFLGLLVDEVRDMIPIDPSQIEPVPANLNTIESSLVTGVVRLDSDLLITLNLKNLVTLINA